VFYLARPKARQIFSIGYLAAPLLLGCTKSVASEKDAAGTSAPLAPASVTASSTPSTPAPQPGKVLDIEAFEQEHDFWCWAASLQTITAAISHNKGIRQCAQADDKGKNGPAGSPSCCGPSMPASCDDRDWPDFPHYGYRVTKTDRCWLSWAQLTDQINQQKPFAFTIRVLGSANELLSVHMYVASGYQVLEDGSRQVLAIDSIAPVSTMWFDFDTYYKESNGWQHSDDFYDVAVDQTATNPPASGNAPPCPAD